MRARGASDDEAAFRLSTVRTGAWDDRVLPSRRRIAELSRLDALTGCLNRRGVEEAVEPALRGLADGSAELSLIVVDLDGFKEVNDAHGHAAGDELIRMTAERLRGCVRPGDLGARMGGDEFAIVLRGESAGARGARVVAERVLAAMREPVVVDGHELLLVGSAGIVHAERGQPLTELLNDADAAMYRAKEEPGFYVEFVPEMRGDSGARMTLLGELRAALRTGQLVLHYGQGFLLGRPVPATLGRAPARRTSGDQPLRGLRLRP